MKTMVYKVLAGEHIDWAIDRARELSKRHRALVRFRFNGVTLVASPKTAAHTLRWLWEKRMSEQASQWRQSPAGKASAARRERELATKQRRLDELMAVMDSEIGGGHEPMLRWLAEFAMVADDVEVSCDLPRVREALVAAGFANNQHVGRPKEEFDDPTVMAEYIAGQAISCINYGMGPHPITQLFVDRWLRKHACESAT